MSWAVLCSFMNGRAQDPEERGEQNPTLGTILGCDTACDVLRIQLHPGLQPALRGGVVHAPQPHPVRALQPTSHDDGAGELCDPVTEASAWASVVLTASPSGACLPSSPRSVSLSLSSFLWRTPPLLSKPAASSSRWKPLCSASPAESH